MHLEANLWCPFCSYRFRACVIANCFPHSAQRYETYCPQNKSTISFRGQDLRQLSEWEECLLVEELSRDQCDLVQAHAVTKPRDIVPIEPGWFTTAVVGLARGIDNEHAFDRLPLLADALEDAGCTDAAILEHCRGPGPHVCGCWVIDLLLGKSE